MYLKKQNKIGDLSKGLQYHLDHDLTLDENIFPYGSDEFCDLICEVRDLYYADVIGINYQEDVDWLDSDSGKKFLNHEGKEFILDLPMIERVNDGIIYFVVFTIEKVDKFKEYIIIDYFEQSVDEIFFNNMTYIEYMKYLSERDTIISI